MGSISKRYRNQLPLIFAVLATLFLTAPAHAQSSLWNGYADTSQVLLNYAPATDQQDTARFYLGAAISNGRLAKIIQISQDSGNSWTVDTGSEGMVITANYLYQDFNINAADFNKPSTGQVKYTSSGLTYYGFYQDVNVGLYNSDTTGKGKLAATAKQMPVFIATSMMDRSGTVISFSCAPNCSAPINYQLEQMGIGFGRGTNAMPAPGAPPLADTDPLLNLTSVAGHSIDRLAPGYVVTDQAITLGLSSAQLTGTSFVKLLPIPITAETGGSAYQMAATANDWQTPAMTLVIKNAALNGTYYGSLLVDTGLSNIELANGTDTAPGLQYDAQDPAQSSTLQIYLPGMATSAGQPLAYTLLYQGPCNGADYGDCPPYSNPIGLSPVYPTNSSNAGEDGIDFVPAAAPGPAFINTGANFLNYFNIVFDPVSGFIGYQLDPQNPPATDVDPQALPSIALQGAVSIPAGTIVSLPSFLFEELSDNDTPQATVQLSTSGTVTLAGQIGSALYCTSGVCTATGLEIAAGRFDLTANNTYLGPTLIDPGGRLDLHGSGSIASSENVTDNGIFDISGTDAAITSLAGSGAVRLGHRTLTLTAATGTFAGAISGHGGLALTGGTQTLTGNSTYTGGTTITGGAMLNIAAAASLGAPNNQLTLDDGGLQALNDVTLDQTVDILSGGGLLDAAGTQLTLNGPVSVGGPLMTLGDVAFANSLAINQGTATINGILTAPSLTVGAAGVLNGTGLIDAPTTIAGTLAPGDDPGTLAFAAPVRLTASSISIFDIDGPGTGSGAGNYSRVIVLTPATFTAAGQLAPILRGITGSATNNFTPAIGAQFNIIPAPSGFSGSYAGLTQPAGLAPNSRFDAIYSPAGLNLVVTPTSYAGIATTANETALALALDTGRPAAGIAMTGAQAVLYNPLYTLTARQIPVALQELPPVIGADSLLVSRGAWAATEQIVDQQLQAERGLPVTGQNQDSHLSGGRTIWFSGIGQTAGVNADGALGYTSSFGGFMAGIDMPVTPTLKAGLAVGYVSTNAQDDAQAQLSGDGVQMTAYGSYRNGIGFLDAQFGGSVNEAHTRQTLAFANTNVSGNTNGNSIGGSATAGLQIAKANWVFEPSLKLSHASLSQGGYNETGTNAPELSISDTSLESTQTLLGATAARLIAVNAQWAIIPQLQLGWLHEYADDRASAAAGFGAPSYMVNTAAIGRDSALLGAGVSLRTSAKLSLFVNYTGLVNGSSNSQNFSGGLRFIW